MKKIVLLAAFLCTSFAGWAQTNTTKALQTQFGEVLSLYFYRNTLRMLNQKEDKDFDELIKNIEKLKFLMIDKSARKFGANEYKKLTTDYRSESYEPIVTSRIEGRNFDIYLNDQKGSTPGTVVLVNDSTNLYILDIIGTIDISKAGALFSAIDGSTDIGTKIRDYAQHKDKKKGKKVTID